MKLTSLHVEISYITDKAEGRAIVETPGGNVHLRLSPELSQSILDRYADNVTLLTRLGLVADDLANELNPHIGA